jgi:hypothetical protein
MGLAPAALQVHNGRRGEKMENEKKYKYFMKFIEKRAETELICCIIVQIQEIFRSF